jgi:DNA polymerase III alpha subunit (gram-positive type)
MSKPEVYVSIDIETDGQAPGVHSMLALGAAAFSQAGDMVSTWYKKLKPLPEARQLHSTMEWWKTQPEAWEEVCKNQQDPAGAMWNFGLWCDEISNDGDNKLVAVAWPAAFDFGFVNYYCWKYMVVNPLGFTCVDIRSYANGLVNHPDYYGTPPLRSLVTVDEAGLRPHVALDDAIGQGRLFMALRSLAVRSRGTVRP